MIITRREKQTSIIRIHPREQTNIIILNPREKTNTHNNNSQDAQIHIIITHPSYNIHKQSQYECILEKQHTNIIIHPRDNDHT